MAAEREARRGEEFYLECLRRSAEGDPLSDDETTDQESSDLQEREVEVIEWVCPDDTDGCPVSESSGEACSQTDKE